MKHRIEKSKSEKIQTIHSSLINGQRKQMANQIDKYGLYDFWSDYYKFLLIAYCNDSTKSFEIFTDATISYHRIRNR